METALATAYPFNKAPTIFLNCPFLLRLVFQGSSSDFAHDGFAKQKMEWEPLRRSMEQDRRLWGGFNNNHLRGLARLQQQVDGAHRPEGFGQEVFAQGQVPEHSAQARRALPLHTPANPPHGGRGSGRVPQHIHLFRRQAMAGQTAAVVPAVGPGSDPGESQAVNEAPWLHGFMASD